MPGCRYVEEIGSVAMLASNRSAGVTPEMNLMKHVCLGQVQIRLPPLALKLRVDVIRSPIKGYQWPHKNDLCIPGINKRKNICKI